MFTCLIHPFRVKKSGRKTQWARKIHHTTRILLYPAGVYVLGERDSLSSGTDVVNSNLSDLRTMTCIPKASALWLSEASISEQSKGASTCYCLFDRDSSSTGSKPQQVLVLEQEFGALGGYRRKRCLAAGIVVEPELVTGSMRELCLTSNPNVACPLWRTVVRDTILQYLPLRRVPNSHGDLSHERPRFHPPPSSRSIHSVAFARAPA